MSFIPCPSRHEFVPSPYVSTHTASSACPSGRSPGRKKRTELSVCLGTSSSSLDSLDVDSPDGSTHCVQSRSFCIIEQIGHTGDHNSDTIRP